MKTVLVSGMFNVLHPGHVRLLRFASECGDHLIVAVQSDKTSDQSSHVNEQLRLEGVQSNTYVDESFLTDDDAVDLVRALKPDVLVKGREHENGRFYIQGCRHPARRGENDFKIQMHFIIHIEVAAKKFVMSDK